MIEELAETVGVDPELEMDPMLAHKLRYLLAAPDGFAVDLDGWPPLALVDVQAEAEHQEQAEDDPDTHVADENVTQPDDQVDGGRDMATTVVNPWRWVSGALAVALAAALVGWVWSYEITQDEAQALRTQLAEHGERAPVAVQPVMYTGSVEPGKPFRATLDRGEDGSWNFMLDHGATLDGHEGSSWNFMLDQGDLMPRALVIPDHELQEGVSLQLDDLRVVLSRDSQ